MSSSRHHHVVLVQLMVMENAFISDAPDVFVNPQEEILHPLKKKRLCNVIYFLFFTVTELIRTRICLLLFMGEKKNTVRVDFSWIGTRYFLSFSPLCSPWVQYSSSFCIRMWLEAKFFLVPVSFLKEKRKKRHVAFEFQITFSAGGWFLVFFSCSLTLNRGEFILPWP